MTKSLYTPKTQFLEEEQPDGSVKVRLFSRRKTLFLFRDGIPMHPIDWSDWMKLQKINPKGVSTSKLHTEQVWVLKEFQQQ